MANDLMNFSASSLPFMQPGLNDPRSLYEFLGLTSGEFVPSHIPIGSVGENGPVPDWLDPAAAQRLQGYSGQWTSGIGDDLRQYILNDPSGQEVWRSAIASDKNSLNDYLKEAAKASAIVGGAAYGLGAMGVPGGVGAAEGAAGLGAMGGGGTGVPFELGSMGGGPMNPALIESAVGGAGYGASYGGAGGISALESGFHALTNPLLNSVGMSGGGNLLGGLGKLGGGGSMDWLQLGGNLLNGYMGSRAAGKAADAQTAAGQEANALQKYIFDQTRADWAPYRDAGVSALGQIQGLLKDPSSIASMPDYQFGLSEGTNALQNSASARGMTYSGQQAKALQKYGQDYAGSKLNESYNRLAGIAGIGQQATGNTQNAGANYGNAVGNTLQQMGNVRGSGYMGQANAWNNAFGNILNGVQQQSIYDQIFGKP